MGIGNIANSGMRAAMSEMEIISNNIANANTNGFKSSSASFSDIYPSSAGSGSLQPGLGVQMTNIAQNFSRGGTTASSDPLNMMINADGFFVVKDQSSGVTSYTRAGGFTTDNEGYITNGNSRLQGFIAVNGQIQVGGTLGDIQIDKTPRSATPTTILTQDINLDSRSVAPAGVFDSNDPTTYNYVSNKQIYDSLGNTHSLAVYYIKSATPNEWTTQVEVDGTNLGAGAVTFNTNGQLATATGMSALTYNPGSGATNPQPIAVSMTGATQFGSSNETRTTSQNGFPVGMYANSTTDKNGNVIATFSNNERVLMGKVAVAKFPSNSGLANIGNMSWVETGDSGAPLLNPTYSDNVINSGTLELSNVDLTQQMISLIGAQHNFQANAQVEQVYNEVMKTVIQI